MLGDMDRRFGSIQQRLQPFLSLDIRKSGQVFAVELEKVESIQGQPVRCGLRSPTAFQDLLQTGEIGIALTVIGYNLAIDQAGREVEPGHGDNERAELVSPVLAVACVHAHFFASRSNKSAITVELDFVHPAIARRDIVDQRGQLGLAIFG